MSTAYFKRAAAYEKMCVKTIGTLCRKCPHRKDSHSGNCIECCPLKRAIEKWQSPVERLTQLMRPNDQLNRQLRSQE